MHRISAALLATSMLLTLTGCAVTGQPVVATRPVLGTAVTITVYSPDTERAAGDAELGFAAMTAVERVLSPYDSSSAIAAFDRSPMRGGPLPANAREILARVRELGVGAQFSPALYGITALYGFDGKGTVPSPESLRSAVTAAGSFRVDANGRASFSATQAVGTPGLDFGGASKGLALDRATAVLAGQPTLITAGSSTLAFGAKPDGEPWRVGIEDPREVGRVVAVVSSVSTLSVSTSGDYQTYFDRGGVRYHHILDPATGLPARGMRSLTVFGRMSSLDADILSTALFVMGRERALDYARAHSIGVYLIDDRGSASSYVPDATVPLEIKVEPRH